MTVDDIRGPVETGQNVQHRLAEKSEPLRFVVEIVESFAPEIVFVVDEVHGHAFMLQLENTAMLTSPAELHRFDAHRTHLAAEFFRNVAIQRDNDPGIDLRFSERTGQRSHHIGQPAGFGEGNRFRGCK